MRFRSSLFYRGERRYSWIATLLLVLLAAAVLLGLLVFYSLQQYMVYDRDAAHLVLSSREDRTEAGDPDEFQVLPLTEVEIVMEKADYSAWKSTAGESLPALRSLYVSGEDVAAGRLAGYIEGMGDYTGLVVELKTESGQLTYASDIALAASYGVNGFLDIRDTVAQLREQGIWLVGQFCCLTDGIMAARNSPLALRSAATGGVYTTREGRAWLDPYNEGTRSYLTELMREARDMGFDELLLTGFYLPADSQLQYSVAMTAEPDAEGAVASLAMYLREQADAMGLRLSVLDDSASPAFDGGAEGQNMTVLFKAFDRVAFVGDAYNDASVIASMRAYAEGNGDTRILPIGEGFAPAHPSYVVK